MLWRWALGLALLGLGWHQGWLTFRLPKLESSPLAALGLLAWAVSYGLSVVRWRFFLSVAGQRLSWREVWTMSLRATFFSTFLPGGVAGDVYRVASGRKGHRADVAWTVWADRWTGFLGLIAWLGITLPLLKLEALKSLGFASVGGTVVLLGALGVGMLGATAFLQKRFGKPWPVSAWLIGLAWSILSHGANMLSLIALVSWLQPLWMWMPLFLALTSFPQLLPAGVGTGHWLAAALFGWAGISQEQAADLYSLYAVGLLLWGCVGAVFFVFRRSGQRSGQRSGLRSGRS